MSREVYWLKAELPVPLALRRPPARIVFHAPAGAHGGLGHRGAERARDVPSATRMGRLVSVLVLEALGRALNKVGGMECQLGSAHCSLDRGRTTYLSPMRGHLPQLLHRTRSARSSLDAIAPTTARRSEPCPTWAHGALK